jgi:hypothetical protein
MTALEWLLWFGLAAVAATLSVVHYRRRETAGRGRLLLAGLRASVLVLALLLLFNPELPARGTAASAGTQVLLDASLSMSLPAGDGATRWERGVAAARARAGSGPILLFGDRVRAVAPAELPDAPPGDPRSLLLPALQAAAEAGVRRVVVVTDGGIEDVAAVLRWVPRLGVEIITESVGAPVANRSLTEVDAPAWVEAGVPFSVEFAVAAPPTDSLRVVARSGGRIIGRSSVAAPAGGRLAAGSLELRLEAAGDLPVAIEIALEDSDPVPDDDQRTVYVHVTERPAGVALVSLRPDWEPRFLMPVLEQALGIPVRGYMPGAAGSWVRLGSGLKAGQRVEEESVRQALARADLVVLHAVGGDAPEWALALFRNAPRLLVFPADGVTGLPLPVQPGPMQAADWFPVAMPASPLAGLLAGQELAGATPLSGLMPLSLPDGAWSPLLVSRGRQAAPLPALVGGSAGGRRWVVALGSGYWQWAFRGGEERQLYARLWSAVAGWLLRERQTVGLPPVRPAQLALPRGLPIPWVTTGVVADSIRVQVIDDRGSVALDTTAVPTAADTAWTATVAPGTFDYRAIAWSGDTVIEAGGPLTVERYSAEFSRMPVDLAPLRAAPLAVRGGPGFAAARRGSTPLHATAWPWVLLVLLLATEWILRRRWGLR